MLRTMGRERQRRLYLVFGVLVGAPVIAIVILRLGLDPFLRLLAADVDLVVVVAG